MGGWEVGGWAGKWMLQKAVGATPKLLFYQEPAHLCPPSPLFSETSSILPLQIREACVTTGDPIAPLSQPCFSLAIITSNTPYFFTHSSPLTTQCQLQEGQL